MRLSFAVVISKGQLIEFFMSLFPLFDVIQLGQALRSHSPFSLSIHIRRHVPQHGVRASKKKNSLLYAACLFFETILLCKPPLH